MVLFYRVAPQRSREYLELFLELKLKVVGVGLHFPSDPKMPLDAARFFLIVGVGEMISRQLLHPCIPDKKWTFKK